MWLVDIELGLSRSIRYSQPLSMVGHGYVALDCGTKIGTVGQNGTVGQMGQRGEMGQRDKWDSGTKWDSRAKWDRGTKWDSGTKLCVFNFLRCGAHFIYLSVVISWNFGEDIDVSSPSLCTLPSNFLNLKKLSFFFQTSNFLHRHWFPLAYLPSKHVNFYFLGNFEN